GIPQDNIDDKGYWDSGCSRLKEHTITKLDLHNQNDPGNMKPWMRMHYDGEINELLRIKLREEGSDEEIFTSVAWIRAFNINEPIYTELCHEFYSTYNFDEICADDELQTKKIIQFRLGGQAHNLTLLEFTRTLGLYQAEELDEDGFDVYFQGGLQNNDHFNAQEYLLSINTEENLSLSRSHVSTIKYPILRNGYANIAWLIAKWIKKKGASTQKESQIYYGQFISKLARKTRVLSDDVVLHVAAPRVSIPRPTRVSVNDFYERMERIEICQEAIKRMEYRQSYHWDRYHGVFEHMAKMYNIPIQGAYNPPGYAQPQYDQFYQQNPPPQYQYQYQQPPPQQQDDDEE
nr:hypothetical protein [Tanacetum cinerariifolium]